MKAEVPGNACVAADEGHLQIEGRWGAAVCWVLAHSWPQAWAGNTGHQGAYPCQIWAVELQIPVADWVESLPARNIAFRGNDERLIRCNNREGRSDFWGDMHTASHPS